MEIDSNILYKFIDCEKTQEEEKKLYGALIDLVKIYDRVPRDVLELTSRKKEY